MRARFASIRASRRDEPFSIMPRYFTLSEAEALLPSVRSSLESAISSKADLAAIDAELQELMARISMSGGSEINPAQVARRKVERAALVKSIGAAIEYIQTNGCVVKDLDMGLLDFPALLGGDEIYLCWKLGEPRIEWWHRINDGFAGRRRIGDGFGGQAPTGRPN